MFSDNIDLSTEEDKSPPKKLKVDNKRKTGSSENSDSCSPRKLFATFSSAKVGKLEVFNIDGRKRGWRPPTKPEGKLSIPSNENNDRTCLSTMFRAQEENSSLDQESSPYLSSSDKQLNKSKIFVSGTENFDTLSQLQAETYGSDQTDHSQKSLKEPEKNVTTSKYIGKNSIISECYLIPSSGCDIENDLLNASLETVANENHYSQKSENPDNEIGVSQSPKPADGNNMEEVDGRSEVIVLDTENYELVKLRKENDVNPLSSESTIHSLNSLIATRKNQNNFKEEGIETYSFNSNKEYNTDDLLEMRKPSIENRITEAVEGENNSDLESTKTLPVNNDLTSLSTKSGSSQSPRNKSKCTSQDSVNVASHIDDNFDSDFIITSSQFQRIENEASKSHQKVILEGTPKAVKAFEITNQMYPNVDWARRMHVQKKLLLNIRKGIDSLNDVILNAIKELRPKANRS